MFELKPLSTHAIDAALERAQTYRLLNEPILAESICRDVLRLDPNHQQALIEFVLALTDQFGDKKIGNINEANEAIKKLESEYHREYYIGILLERRAISHLKSPSPGRGFVAYDWLRDAMQHYENAEQIRPKDNDESILRWNTCVRLIERHPEIRESEDDDHHLHHFDS